ncbi:hypothetical protein OIU79_018816, partial [Salix purpurea]
MASFGLRVPPAHTIVKVTNLLRVLERKT